MTNMNITVKLLDCLQSSAVMNVYILVRWLEAAGGRMQVCMTFPSRVPLYSREINNSSDWLTGRLYSRSAHSLSVPSDSPHHSASQLQLLHGTMKGLSWLANLGTLQKVGEKIRINRLRNGKQKIFFIEMTFYNTSICTK